jgi:Flp pilus assembly protein TadD
LYDVNAHTVKDFWAHQKIFLVTAATWHASVCFNGVGKFNALYVSEWLAERLASIQPQDQFDRLLDELLTADTWLSKVPPPNNKHSFTIGAFVGSKPVFALVTNYEGLSGSVAANAAASLSVLEQRPSKPKTFVSGQKHAVLREARRRLTALAAREPEPRQMFSVLASVNRDAAKSSHLVSPACFTTYVRRTGEGGGYPHDIVVPPFPLAANLPKSMRDEITQLLDKQFGAGNAGMRQMVIGRAAATDDYHETQLRDNPNDPSAHSNYAAFLNDNKGDIEGAEREYRKAIDLDANHAIALGNLASLMWKKGEIDQAANLYRRALEAGPGQENVSWNYANFLIKEFDDRRAARETLDRGIAANPNSGRLFQYRAALDLLDGNASDALEGFQRAREKGADQALVEAGYACALQATGAPVNDCIAAYRTAIAANPNNGALTLNLAQLMFAANYGEANKLLREAEKLGLDYSAQLEAQFYTLAHTKAKPEEVFRSMKSLFAKGARLNWNVQPNIETVRERDAQKADLLNLVCEALTGKRDQASLDQILARWPLDRS